MVLNSLKLEIFKTGATKFFKNPSDISLLVDHKSVNDCNGSY